MKFKYSEKINILGISNCPPNECSAVEDSGICYRWVHENIAHQNNFIPVLEINPKRINSPSFKEDSKKCLGFALSMHDSLDNSRNHFYNVLADLPNFFQIVGTHVVELNLETDDGYRTKSSKVLFDKGHFDFFEQKNLNWTERISNKFEIKNE